jgi:hypothetical protein
MASIFTPSTPITGPWVIDREDCIGDSLGFINANTNFLGVRVNTLSANLNTKFNNTGGTITGSLTATGNVFTPNRPRFNIKFPAAAYSNDNMATLLPAGNGTVTGWGSAVINDGNFSLVTGKYTAPVTGVYMINFWVTWSIPTGSGTDFAISVNDTSTSPAIEPVVVVKPATNFAWTNGSITRIVALNQGDTVSVRTTSFDNRLGHGRAEFSGFLIG